MTDDTTEVVGAACADAQDAAARGRRQRAGADAHRLHVLVAENGLGVNRQGHFLGRPVQARGYVRPFARQNRQDVGRQLGAANRDLGITAGQLQAVVDRVVRRARLLDNHAVSIGGHGLHPRLDCEGGELKLGLGRELDPIRGCGKLDEP